MRRALRWLLGTLVVLMVLTVAALIGLRYYLTSPRVAEQAAERLRSTLGMPVRVRGADVGITGGSSLRGIELFESDESDRPWASVEEAHADVAAVGLARGDTPRELVLRGAAVELHFAADGTLLTRLPRFDTATSGGPRVRIESGRLTLRQDGREPLVLHGIDVRFDLAAEGGATLTGTLSDPKWGQWTLDGSFAAGRVGLHLSTSRAVVTQDMLRTVPFVPPKVWKQVRAEGETAADVTLRFGTDSTAGHYRVALDVRRAGVDVTAVALHAAETAGSVVIEDGVARLRDVTGRVAGGELAVSAADLDFRAATARMTFAFTAKDLDPRRLPEAWRAEGRMAELLKTFAGELRLRGKANLTVTVAPDGAVRTAGGGEAVLLGAKLAGKEARITLRIDLADGFRVSSLARPLLSTALLLHAPKPSSHVEVNLELEDVDVAALVRELGLTLPLRVAGRLSFRVKADIPLTTPRDLKTYRLEGTATLPTLELHGLALRAVEAKFHCAEGTLHLDRLDGRIPDPSRPDDEQRGGRFGGTARWGLLVDDGELTADVKLDSAPMAALRPLLPGPADTAGGSVSGSLRGDVASAKMTDPAAWRVSGRLRSDEVRLYGWRLRELRADLKAEKGVARLTDLRGELEGAAVTGSGELRLTDPFTYKTTLKIGDTDLTALARLSPELRPPVAVGGRVAGRATVEGKLDGRAAPAFAVDLDFTDLDVGALAKAVPELPLKVDGKATGRLRVVLPPAAADRPRDVAADLTVTEGRIRIQNIPTRRLKGTVKVRGGVTEYELEGETLGGRFRLDGQVPARPRGRLRVERAQLALLWEALRLPSLAPLTGRFDIDLPFAFGDDNRPVGRGRFVLSDVRHGEATLAEELRGDVWLADESLDFRDVTGRLAGGLARLRVHYDLRRPDRSFFTVSAERAESSVLLRPWQGTSEVVRGPADVHLRGRLGSEWNGGGDVTLRGSRVFGVAVNEWRLPIDFRFTPAQGRGELTVSDSHGQVGRGRVTGRAALRWGGVNRLEGTLRFSSVEVRELLGNGESSFASGRTSGRFDFGATDLRSVNDLTGSLEASLDDTQAMRMPVLRELARYVTPGRGWTRFETGDVRGRLANGVFRLQRLALAGVQARLVLEGTVTLTGRLDLRTTAWTGNLGASSMALRLLGLRLPNVGPVPLDLLNEASGYLSNRTLHVRVTGTINSPVVRVEPVRLLTEEAVRFFLIRAILPIP